ncbi:MAG: glutathione peroxidase [Acidobacteria bacterium]|nr:MAG: glutathione peroxidase [Acidobacteriota bacterium]
MKAKLTSAFALAVVLAALFALSLSSRTSVASSSGEKMNSIYDFSLKDIDHKEVNLSQYRGKVVLVVNVASRCGYTPQYEGLQKVYMKYRDRGFVILGFPANNFMAQEPGTDEEIKTFCSAKYNVTFPIFSKISVKGDDIHPLYKYLTSKETDPEFGGDIKWNFSKFLVDKTGKIIARFEPKVTPESDPVIQAIEKAL